MKLSHLFLMIGVAIISSASNYSFAQNKATIADGDWNDPGIWSPSGVPNLFSDSIFVEHQLFVNAKLIFNGIEFVHISANACLINPNEVDTLAIVGAADVIVDGFLQMGFISNMSNNMVVNGQVRTNIRFINSDSLTITSNAKADLNRFNNIGKCLLDGELMTGYIYNNFLLDGSGHICVADTLYNNGTIQGSLDLCDATPSGPGDYNNGVIGVNVTYCAVPPCSGLTLTCGTADIEIVPNSMQIQKELVKIIDFMGRETEFKPNIPLIYIYSDGTRRRVFKMED